MVQAKLSFPFPVPSQYIWNVITFMCTLSVNFCCWDIWNTFLSQSVKAKPCFHFLFLSAGFYFSSVSLQYMWNVSTFMCTSSVTIFKIAKRNIWQKSGINMFKGHGRTAANIIQCVSSADLKFNYYINHYIVLSHCNVTTHIG